MATKMKLRLSAKEGVLVGLTATLVPIVLVEIYAVAEMRHAIPEVEDDPDMPHARDLLIGLGFALVIIALRRLMTAALKPVGRLLLAPKKQSEDRLQRFGTVLFKFLYFIVVTTIGFAVLKDEKWFPAALGGSGDAANAFFTHETPSAAHKLYYMLQTGYHLHSLLYMVFLSPIRNDFVEMLLHHLVTLILIVGSYLSNYTAIGALIAFVHDLGDVSGYAIKSVVDTGNIPLLVVCYAVLLASWGYTRLYVYPVHLVSHVIFTLPKVHPEVLGVFLYPGIALLGMLQLLHVYWYCLFLVMGYMLAIKGKAEDIQEKCDASKEPETEPVETIKPKRS